MTRRIGRVLSLLLSLAMSAAMPCGSNEKKVDILKAFEELENPAPEIREEAAMKLLIWADIVRDDPLKPAVIISLKKLLADKNKAVRYSAILALGDIDYTNKKEILPLVLEIIKDKTEAEHKRSYAFDSRILFGPEAGDAIPIFVELMKEQPKISHMYHQNLKRIGIPESLKIIEPVERIYNLNRALLKARTNCLIALFFGLLFWWSVKLRKKGIIVFHWALLVPLLFYTLLAIERGIFEDYWIMPSVNSKIFYLATAPFPGIFDYATTDLLIGFVVYSAVALIPWLTSWLLIWRRRKPAADN